MGFCIYLYWILMGNAPICCVANHNMIIVSGWFFYVYNVKVLLPEKKKQKIFCRENNNKKLTELYLTKQKRNNFIYNDLMMSEISFGYIITTKNVEMLLILW